MTNLIQCHHEIPKFAFFASIFQHSNAVEVDEAGDEEGVADEGMSLDELMKQMKSL